MLRWASSSSTGFAWVQVAPAAEEISTDQVVFKCTTRTSEKECIQMKNPSYCQHLVRSERWIKDHIVWIGAWQESYFAHVFNPTVSLFLYLTTKNVPQLRFSLSFRDFKSMKNTQLWNKGRVSQATKKDQFSEKFQTAFDLAPSALIFGKLCCNFFRKRPKILYKGPKYATYIFGLKMPPPPLGSLPK